VTLTTTVLIPATGESRVLFFWSEGERPAGLYTYAHGSLHCSSPLLPLPGYPVSEQRGKHPGENENLILLEEDFRAQAADAPVIFHFLLPVRFVPYADRSPLVTPSRPSILLKDDQLSVTFVATGAADVRFWIKRLQQNEEFEDFDFERLFNKPSERSAKATIEINLGIIKFGFGDR
jgi:hypothetical protein